jgi:hypothetical protein
MKRYFIILIYFCFINNILAQESKIIYTFPPLVYKALNVGLEDLPAFHDTTNFVIANQNCDLTRFKIRLY